MNWARPRQLIVLLAAVTLVPTGVLVWLTVRMLVQDRDVERQRQTEALKVDAARVALDIDRRLEDLGADLARGEGHSAPQKLMNSRAVSRRRPLPIARSPDRRTPAAPGAVPRTR